MNALKTINKNIHISNFKGNKFPLINIKEESSDWQN